MIKTSDANSLQMKGGCSKADCNDGTGCCPAGQFCMFNFLWVLHQDGTLGRYVHMPKNGIVPQQADFVRRGELVATIGVVGRSSGPHLHFDTPLGPGLPAELALFEAKLAVGGIQLECYEPTEGMALISTNVPQ